jgi:hypothetical protein
LNNKKFRTRRSKRKYWILRSIASCALVGIMFRWNNYNKLLSNKVDKTSVQGFEYLLLFYIYLCPFLLCICNISKAIGNLTFCFAFVWPGKHSYIHFCFLLHFFVCYYMLFYYYYCIIYLLYNRYIKKQKYWFTQSLFYINKPD